MLAQTPHQKIDFLVAGHFSKDLLPNGDYLLGGTAAYAARTAHALGLRVGIVTSFPKKELGTLNLPTEIQIFNIPAQDATTFTNTETPHGRVQRIHAQAAAIDLLEIPQLSIVTDCLF